MGTHATTDRVWSEMNTTEEIIAALTAAGLERTLVQGYRFLVDRYQAGDRISLFGFSRGAYTAR